LIPKGEKCESKARHVPNKGGDMLSESSHEEEK